MCESVRRAVCCWSVGLVQREIESAGVATISLSMMPELTASVGVPRIAAIEHPFGLTLRLPGDVERQIEVLRRTLRALEEISQPGRHPWYFPRFLKRNPPECQEGLARPCQ